MRPDTNTATKSLNRKFSNVLMMMIVRVGWMNDLRFISFSSVFQSNQDDARVIIEGYTCNGNPVYN